MRYFNGKKLLIILCILAVIGCISGCEEEKKKPVPIIPPTTETPTEEGQRYNKTDKVVVLDINTDESTITAKSIVNDNVYLMNYNGGTNVLDKFGTEMTMAQLSKGIVTDVFFVEGTQKLIKIQVSNDIWEFDEVTGVMVYPGEKMVKYAGTKYKYDSGVVVISDGKIVDIDEIVAEDTITVRGVDNKIISIVVDKGHGYLKLTDTADFEGGVVEVGRYITKVVESDMVITVPEGVYKFAVANNGIGGESELTVKKGETIPVSLLKYKNKIDKYGLVNFIIKPEGAVLSIDGKETSYKEEVQLQYGTHKIEITAKGYETFTLDFTVDNTYTTLTVDMDGESDKETEPQTTVPEEETTKVDSDSKIYISCPTEGVSVYFDGVYKGKAPVSFEKVTGTHIVILMKTGYETKIVSVEIKDDGDDFIKVFEALEKDE